MAYNYEYPYTDASRTNSDWILSEMKKIIYGWVTTLQEWNDTKEEWEELREYVKNFFSNLDVSEEIDNKIDEMMQNGELADIFKQLLLDVITPEMFGAVGDGVSDDTQAIKDCIEEATLTGRAINGNGNYAIYDTLSIDGSKVGTAIFRGTIYPKFTDRDAVLIYGTRFNGIYEFHVMGMEYNGGFNFNNFSDFDYGEVPMVGIRVKNVIHSTLTLTARNCGTGVMFEGNSVDDENEGGNSYNTVYITDVGDCAVGLDLMAKNAGGWVNENLFINFSVQDYGSNTAVKDKNIGIRLWTNGSTLGLNNNVFIKPSLQNDGLPVLLSNSSSNAFLNCRCEKRSTTLPYARFLNSYGNIFDVLYGAEYWNGNFFDEVGTPYKNTLLTTNKKRFGSLLETFSWQFNKEKCVSYGDKLYIEDIDVFSPYDATKITGEPSMYTYHTISDNGFTSVNGTLLGRLIDVRQDKEFYVKASSFSTASMSMQVVAFDENLQVMNITAADFGGIYKLEESNGYVTTVNNIQIYVTPTDANNALKFYKILNNNIKYVFVGVRGTDIYDFRLYTDVNTTITNKYFAPATIKRQYGLDRMNITDATLIKNAYVGMYVKTVDATVRTDELGTYITRGYLCTETGTTDTWIADKIYTAYATT